jgi:AcrR family transcriptional regulator
VRSRDPDRKSKIIAAAAELIGESGYYTVSMADIGAAAGITGSGIYRHFDSKSAILVVLLDQVVDDLNEEESAIVGRITEPKELLRELVRTHVGFVVHRREFAKVYYSEIDNLPVEDGARLRRKQRLYLEEWVHPLIELRHDLDEAEARTLVHAAVGSIQSALFHRAGLDRDRLSARLQQAAEAVLGLE